MLSITATADWHSAHPGGAVGLLEISGASNTDPRDILDPLKRGVEDRLRSRYAGQTRQDLLALPVLAAYQRYYKRFTKTYHVQLQLESILKGKNLPNVSPLVDANFASELETLVLTAGHDVDRLREPVIIDVSRAGERMTMMNGTAREVHAGDMVMRDAEGIACSISMARTTARPSPRRQPRCSMSPTPRRGCRQISCRRSSMGSSPSCTRSRPAPALSRCV